MFVNLPVAFRDTEYSAIQRKTCACDFSLCSILGLVKYTHKLQSEFKIYLKIEEKKRKANSRMCTEI